MSKVLPKRYLGLYDKSFYLHPQNLSVLNVQNTLSWKINPAEFYLQFAESQAQNSTQEMRLVRALSSHSLANQNTR